MSKSEFIAGWGRTGVRGSELWPVDLERGTEGAVLSRGLGRSYGDSSLPPADHPQVVNTTKADRMLGFDEESGILRGEAGLSLLEINRVFLERGWFLPVTPGTQFVTLGGAVAADVHGKNHHVAGCFGEHVTELKMRVADGRVLTVSRDKHADLFNATVGGMGLTGHILEVAFRMDRVPSPWIMQTSYRVPDIESFMSALEDAANTWPMTMGWIDCVTQGRGLGRGALMAGRWAEPGEAKRRQPKRPLAPRLFFDFPEWALGKLSVKAFNEVYYRSFSKEPKEALVSPYSFFYPLDIAHDWNRMYGRRGFTQYQCVVPKTAPEAPRRVLELLSKNGSGSFLAVIKDCGAEGFGLLSFPMPGVSIALDLPIRDDTQALIDQLNEYVITVGGRIYLAKDSFTRREHFEAMEPRLAAFNKARDKWDPERRFRSAQSVRIFGS